ncbi:MAG: hypothetical protein DI535_00770 [Citrobacter freundii]|nr:MAG: hypothetical protein DI535_00770 [Citrobacter freundii]
MRPFKLFAYLLFGLAFPIWVILARLHKSEGSPVVVTLDSTTQKLVVELARQNAINQTILTEMLLKEIAKNPPPALQFKDSQYLIHSIRGLLDTLTIRLTIRTLPLENKPAPTRPDSANKTRQDSLSAAILELQREVQSKTATAVSQPTYFQGIDLADPPQDVNLDLTIEKEFLENDRTFISQARKNIKTFREGLNDKAELNRYLNSLENILSLERSLDILEKTNETNCENHFFILPISNNTRSTMELEIPPPLIPWIFPDLNQQVQFPEAGREMSVRAGRTIQLKLNNACRMKLPKSVSLKYRRNNGRTTDSRSIQLTIR